MCLFALAQSFKLPQMLMGQIAQSRCYKLGGYSSENLIRNDKQKI